MSSPSGALKITVLGSGTSVGVPTIACHCAVCESSDPRDTRLRPSVLFTYNGRNVIIDTTPDFRTQVLRARVDRLDAIIYTHEHADHILGLDDVRPFNYRQGAIPVYGSEVTLEALRRCFPYCFDGIKSESSIPKIKCYTIREEAFDLFGVLVQPVVLRHGSGSVLGFRIGAAAYLTDHSEIPEDSLRLLRGLDVLFLDALRRRPHPTHTTVERALEYVELLAPKRAFFTHICHELAHEETQRTLPSHVRLAEDGLEILVEEPRK